MEEMPEYKPYSYTESSGGFGQVILIGVLLIVLLGVAFYFLSGSNEPHIVTATTNVITFNPGDKVIIKNLTNCDCVVEKAYAGSTSVICIDDKKTVTKLNIDHGLLEKINEEY